MACPLSLDSQECPRPPHPDRQGRGLTWLSPPACTQHHLFLDQCRLKSSFDFLFCPLVPLPSLHVLIPCVFTPLRCLHVQLQGRRDSGDLSGGTGLPPVPGQRSAGSSGTVLISCISCGCGTKHPQAMTCAERDGGRSGNFIICRAINAA